MQWSQLSTIVWLRFYRLDRIEERIEALNQALNFLTTEFIRSSAQQARANYERLERIEAVVAENAQSISRIDSLIEANQRQIAANTENITRLETKVNNLAETVCGQSNRIPILIDEGRADRQAQREALAAIINNSNRIEILERRVS